MPGCRSICPARAGSNSINGIVGNRDLIRVAVVRDPRQAVPLSGTWTGFPSDNLGMTVEVQVTVAPAAAIPPYREQA